MPCTTPTSRGPIPARVPLEPALVLDGPLARHTGYSASLSCPLVAVTALATASGREPVRTGGACVDDRVLVTKRVALEGTVILDHDFADVALRLRLSEGDLAGGRRGEEDELARIWALYPRDGMVHS